jgi:hypothetical protein
MDYQNKILKYELKYNLFRGGMYRKSRDQAPDVMIQNPLLAIRKPRDQVPDVMVENPLRARKFKFNTLGVPPPNTEYDRPQRLIKQNAQRYLIPKLFRYEDFELFVPQNAGYSDDILEIITPYFRMKNRLNIKGKVDPSNEFSMMPFHIGEYGEPYLGAGAYTAVYKIIDINNKIKQSLSDQYILRVYVRANTHSEKNMFDYQKVNTYQ